MLSTRTKQINSYGKRSKRVVDVTVSDAQILPKQIISIFEDLPPAPAWAPLASRMKKRENAVPKQKAPSPKVVGMQRKKRLSPVLSPIKKTARITQLIKESRIPSGGDGLLHLKPKPKPLPEDDTNNSIPASPPRAPLSSFSMNVPGSPALPANMRAAKQRIGSGKVAPIKLAKAGAPLVDLDIIVLDEDGRTIRKERRVSRTGVQANPVNATRKVSQPKGAPKVAPKVSIYVDSDSEPENISQPKPLRRSKKPQGRVIVSDGSASESDDPPSPPPSPQPTTGGSQIRKPPGKHQTLVGVLVPPPPYAIRPVAKSSTMSEIPRTATPPRAKANPLPMRAPQFHPIPSPIPKARQLTPIRGTRTKALFQPPSPPSPSTPTDLDFSLDLSELSLDSASQSGHSFHLEQEIPEYLRDLLAECHQEDCGPHEFSAFIDSFPFDPVIQSAHTSANSPVQFRKIGEASYSEVFGIGDVVLKVIPLRDESPKDILHDGAQKRFKMTSRSKEAASELEADGPPPTDAQDVRKEIIVTRAMGEVHDGFVKLLKTYIVKGRYPELLLSLWDEYNERKGSESIRPDTFTLSQVYAIIVLPNGGPDLEAYTFSNPTKMGWRQASSIFWQVAKSLSHAEHLVSFEHRDLHWGQILVKNVSSKKPRLRAINMNQGRKPRNEHAFMDDLCHGVQATIIDLGLSRMDAGDGSDGIRVQWTPFDEEIFMGEGDYQFDVYRMMRDLSGGEWEGYQPMTNVMWLHYLLVKLIRSKGLKAPAVVRKGKGTAEAPVPSVSETSFSEKDCYESLLDLEGWLSQCLSGAFPSQAKAVAKGRGRRKATVPDGVATHDVPACAGEIVEYGVKRGWISAAILF